MRGRLPKPARLELVEGNPGKRNLARQLAHAAQLEIGAETPANLSPTAAVEWRRIAADLRDAALLTKIDGPMLAIYCEAYARCRAAADIVAKRGSLVRTAEGGVKLTPPVTALRHAEAAMLRTLGEFGCSRRSRCRVRAASGRRDEDDPFDDF